MWMRAVHRLEQVAVDLALLHAVGQLGAGAAFLGQLLDVLAIDQRRELAVAVVRVVPAGAVQVQPADVRGEDLAVALAAQVLADEVLQLLADDRALGLPEDQALADRLVDGEQPQLLARARGGRASWPPRAS